MPEGSKAISYQKANELGKQIAKDGTPEQCEGCYLPRMIARTLGIRVQDGEITLIDATSSLKEEISTNCRHGSVAIGGCFGGRRCGYGIRRRTA